MPLYEYACRQCGGHFDVLQKFSDQPLKVHEGCGGEVERLISAPALQFKGTGWYVTDYAGKTTKGDKSESESTSESKSDKTEKKSKESSPAKKTADKPSSSKASTGD